MISRKKGPTVWPWLLLMVMQWARGTGIRVLWSMLHPLRGMGTHRPINYFVPVYDNIFPEIMSTVFIYLGLWV